MASRVHRQVLAGVVAVVATFTLSGCGSANPGTAARIGDQTLSTSEVDELTVAYCDALRPVLEGQGAVFPMSFVRAYVVRNLSLQAAAEQLAEEYSVDLPATYGQALRDLRGQLAASYREDRIDQAVEVDRVQAYLPAVEVEVGGILLARDGDSGADDAAKQARGQDALQEWLSENPVEVNPRYGINVSDPSLQRPDFVDTGTSFPVSANAVDADKIGSEEGPDPAYAASLPSSQRCG